MAERLTQSIAERRYILWIALFFDARAKGDVRKADICDRHCRELARNYQLTGLPKREVPLLRRRDRRAFWKAVGQP